MKALDFVKLNKFFDGIQAISEHLPVLEDSLKLTIGDYKLNVTTDLEHSIKFSFDNGADTNQDYSAIVYTSEPCEYDDCDIYLPVDQVTRKCMVAYLTLKDSIEENKPTTLTV